jgi:CHAT domain-containing protein/Tfp pilus assembly protein PilF
MLRPPTWLVLALALTLSAPIAALAQSPPAGSAPATSTDETLRRAWDLKAEALKAFQEGRFQEAIPKAREAVELRERVLGPDDLEVGEALDLLGRVLERNGEYPAAEAALARALRIKEAKIGPSTASAADTLEALAQVNQQTGRIAGARPLYERALRIREDLLGPEAPEVAAALTGLGWIQVDQGDLPAARITLERALKIREKTLGPNHLRTSQTLAHLGRVYRDLGEYDQARVVFERALRIQERALGPEHPDLGYVLAQYGVLYERLDDHLKARPLLERALAIREKALGPNHPSVAWNLTQVVVVLRALNENAAAMPLVERALRIQEQALGPNSPQLAETLRNRARVATELRDYVLARNDLERALRIAEPVLGPNHPRIGLLLNNLGIVLLQTRDSARAQATLERAMVVLRNGGLPEIHWRTANLLGRFHERSGKRVEAAAAYAEAATVIRGLAGSLAGQQSRAQYLEAGNRLAVFDSLARVLLRLHERDATKGYELEALAAIEAKKNLLVATTMAAARPTLQDPEARRVARDVGTKREETARLERALQAEQGKSPDEQRPERIQALTQDLARTKSEYLAQVQAFLARYPRYRAQFVEQQTVDPKAIAKFAERLPPGTLAVQYFAAPDALYIFVVAAGGKFQVRTQAVPQKDLYDLVRAYRTQVERAAAARLPWTDDGSDAFRTEVAPLRATTEKLAAHLLAPIEPELATHKDVILFPNDLLLYLPIHALTRKQPDGSSRFLAETHRVSYVTQLELVDLLSPLRMAPDAPLLALANPDGTLPAASREVRELARSRPGVTALDGPEATKPRFFELAIKFPELHLATHGVLDPEQPDRSYLLLAGDDPASQRLTIGEIAGLSLPPNSLAILSGCETALGEQVPGAALVTLAAAFSQAGSQSVVASLWKVSDVATRDFMVAFHRALPTAGRAGAVQEAELALLRVPATMHPYYWAPFLLLGAR